MTRFALTALLLAVLLPAVGCKHKCCKSNSTSYAPPPCLPVDDGRR